MRKYLCTGPGRKYEQLAKPVSSSLLCETTKFSLTVLPTVQESSQHHPSAEGVQLINPAQNCSPLTEPLQCPSLHCKGYQHQVCWTKRYLLVNYLWLHVNVSLKHKRLLSPALLGPGEFLNLVCKVWRETIYTDCHLLFPAGFKAPWTVTFPVPSQNQAGLPSRGKWRWHPPPPFPTSGHATFWRNTPVPSHSYVFSMHCFGILTHFTKCCKKGDNTLFIISSLGHRSNSTNLLTV